jgi:hypothetical protein
VNSFLRVAYLLPFTASLAASAAAFVAAPSTVCSIAPVAELAARLIVLFAIQFIVPFPALYSSLPNIPTYKPFCTIRSDPVVMLSFWKRALLPASALSSAFLYSGWLEVIMPANALRSISSSLSVSGFMFSFGYTYLAFSLKSFIISWYCFLPPDIKFDLSLSTLASLTSPLFSNFMFSISRPVAVVATYEPMFNKACPFGPKNAPPIAAPVFNAIAILPAVEALEAAI